MNFESRIGSEFVIKPFLTKSWDKLGSKQFSIIMSYWALCIQRPRPLTFESMIDSAAQTDLDRKRSIQNRNIVCKCGEFKSISSIVKSKEARKINRVKAWGGHKKRSRCKNCIGCLAPRCNKCKFCLTPHLKKPCGDRKCLFPKVPTCPCFAKWCLYPRIQ